MSRKRLTTLFFAVVVVLLGDVSALAKETYKLNVAYAAALNGTPIAPGDYKVSWESHSANVTVTFRAVKGGKVIATAQGKIVDHGVPYVRNAVVYDTQPDGSRSIIEIRIAGTSQAIVFSELKS